jgi:two-component system LytT family response regulator
MLRVLIVDDESNIRTMIAEIVKNFCDGAEVVGQAGSVKEGIERIETLHPDLVLLDIKMDDGSGFDLLGQVDRINFKVVFITAYQEFALQAIKFSALDYILKPVDPEELIKAVDTARELVSDQQQIQLKHLTESLNNQDQSNKRVLLKTSDSIHLVHVDEIRYCEADGGYTHFYTDKVNNILVSRALAEYEELFKGFGFFRVHKSFLVNLQKVLRFEKDDGGQLVMEGDARVPVASRKREQLFELLEKITE